MIFILSSYNLIPYRLMGYALKFFLNLMSCHYNKYIIGKMAYCEWHFMTSSFRGICSATYAISFLHSLLYFKIFIACQKVSDDEKKIYIKINLVNTLRTFAKIFVHGAKKSIPSLPPCLHIFSLSHSHFFIFILFHAVTVFFSGISSALVSFFSILFHSI